jgi:hypothetical protein
MREVWRPLACVRGERTNGTAGSRVHVAWRSAPRPRPCLGGRARGKRQLRSRAESQVRRGTASAWRRRGGNVWTRVCACDVASSASPTRSIPTAPVVFHGSQTFACELSNLWIGKL